MEEVEIVDLEDVKEIELGYLDLQSIVDAFDKT